METKRGNGAAPCAVIDPVESAKTASLRYVTDTMPGIQRKRNGKGFRYIGVNGKLVRNADELGRIKALAIPPAWQDVWICLVPHGHLQATGRDARRRKQYRYHARWRQVRDGTKYDRMIAFGQALPMIRKKVEGDLTLPGLPREKVLAAVVRLLEMTLIRVGNEEYARHNGSFGLTTLRNHHVEVSGSTLRFEFRGKSGVKHVMDLSDLRLAKVVKRCRDLPGYELFQYVGDDGERHTIDSGDVNEYLRAIAGEDFSSRDFRTWAGTVLAAWALHEFKSFDSEAQAKRNIAQAIEAVAKRLGNTKAVCRKCYIHPAVINSYLEGSLLSILSRRVEKKMAQSLKDLDPEETAVMALLMQQLKPEAERRAQNGRARRTSRSSSEREKQNLRKTLRRSLDKLRAVG